MTIRTKTIEYAFDANRTTTVVNAATRFEFQTMSLYIPETASRTFRSALLEVNYRDTVTAATSQTSALIGIKLQTASFSDTTVTQTMTNSGEQQSFVLLRDVTDYFNSNFTTNPTASCQVAVQFGALATNNHSAKLYLTYDYDDVVDIRTKTVRIPVGSIATILSGSGVMTEIGAGSIPALDTFLPEVGKAYRQIWFDVMGNDSSGTSDYYLLLRLDTTETGTTSSAHEGGLGSSLWHKTVWVRNDMTTNTTHSFYAGTLTTAGPANVVRFSNLAALLNVTYEYTHSATSQSMNSIMIPLMDESGFPGTSFYGNYSQLQQTLYISEPAPIITKQSGLMMYYLLNGSAPQIRIAVNNQSGSANHGSTIYDKTNAGSLQCGQNGVMHRFEDGINLRRGKNIFTITYEQAFPVLVTDNTISGVTAVGYINYTSGKHASGDSVHNQTRIYQMYPETLANAPQRYSTTFAPTASVGSFYRTTGLGFGLCLNLGGIDGGISLTVRPTDAETGSGVVDGWTNIYQSSLDTTLERGVYTPHARAQNVFKRYPTDADTTRINLLESHRYNLEVTGPTSTINLATTYLGGGYCFWTYHNIYTPVTRSITGFTVGNGSAISIAIFESGSDDLRYTTTSVSGGQYSFVAYDANTKLYATAYDSASGRGGLSRYFTPVI